MRHRHVTLAPLALALVVIAGNVAGGCSSPEHDRRVVNCERTNLDGRDYCVYGSQAITETGYDCPRDLDQGVPMGDGTVCTKDGEIPEQDRDDLRRRVDGADAGGSPGGDASPGDAGTSSCTAPSSCPAGSSSSSDEPPSYHCHTPTEAPTGETFELTIYGQYLSTYSDGEIDVATDTGFKQNIQVDHRCKVTVELPAYVWNNGDSFTVTVTNDADHFQFDVRGN